MDYTEIKKYSNNDQADISVILCPIEKYEDNGRAEFYYDSAVIEPEKWVCATYYLRNTGHTEIDHLYLSTNLVKNTSLFNAENGENKMCYNHHFLNYSVILEKSIKPKECVCLKVCYVSDKVMFSNMGNATISVYLIDDNKKVVSTIVCTENKLYTSERSSHKNERLYR